MTDIVNDPHPFDEDPEQYVGEKTQDPWDDPDQTDWPGTPLPVEEESA